MAAKKDPQSKKPITTIVRRTIKIGKEIDFEKWVADTTKDLKKFPGYMDITMIKPTGSTKEYVLIIRFDSYEHVNNWENSSIRNKWMERAKDFTENLSNTKVTGLEYWFPLPEIPKASVPPRPKMATVTMVGIYPLSIVINYLLSFVPFPIHPLIKGLLITIMMVLTMTYFVMPFLTGLFRPWLFPKKS